MWFKWLLVMWFAIACAASLVEFGAMLVSSKDGAKAFGVLIRSIIQFLMVLGILHFVI